LTQTTAAFEVPKRVAVVIVSGRVEIPDPGLPIVEKKERLATFWVNVTLPPTCDELGRSGAAPPSGRPASDPARRAKAFG
jgi:hypothetical protein